MGMWTTDNQDTLSVVLKSFSQAAGKNYPGFDGSNNHAFEAGYLQSVIISILPMLPKKQQKILIEDMVRATQNQERQLLAKMNKEQA